MERVDKILKAENNIKEIPNPKPLNGLNDKIELRIFHSVIMVRKKS